MTLEEYRKLVLDAETKEPSIGLSINCGILANKLETALWNSWCKVEAVRLANRFRAIQEKANATASS